jgi:N,N'-diacetyllegionaminate synthase
MQKTFIIAEAGVNHNGSFKIATNMIDVAKESGADAIKFQTWKTEALMKKDTKLANYQKKNVGNFKSQYEMAKNLELSYQEFRRLKNYCDKKKILFLSTPDEPRSAKFLNELQDIFKIGSGEITNLPFLSLIGSFKKQIILSTGMSNLQEVKDAVKILVSSGTHKKDITVLHCTSEYPASIDEINLNAIQTISDTLKIKVGYSDHSLCVEVPIAAVALGATVIEKHFTLDRSMIGPDHKASLEPHELKGMIESIRIVEKILGDGIKRPFPSEKGNIHIVRKSIVAKIKIKKGEIFTDDNLTVKRPGNGICPMKWNEVIGQASPKNFETDELIIL